MTKLRLVDSHVHLWKLDKLIYPWLTPPFSKDGPCGSVAAIATDYGLNEYFADSKNFTVDKIVHIDAGAAVGDALAETRWLQGLADETGFPQAIVAFAPLDDPNVEELLAAHVAHPCVRGIRHILNWHADPKRTYTPSNLLDADAFSSGFSLLAKYRLSFDLQVYPGQMKQAAALAAKHPQTPVILNHMGMPVDDDRMPWREGIRALAALPNVAIKISGMGFVDRNWTASSMREIILYAIDAFGTERCLFASDFPTDKLFNSYGRAIAAYDDITRGFSPAEREAMFAANAERIYRI